MSLPIHLKDPTTGETHTIGLTWKHVQAASSHFKGHTFCFIFAGEKKLATGTAFCSKSDQYTREMGRKVSLKKAMSTFPREVRREIWRQYHERRHHNTGGSELGPAPLVVLEPAPTPELG